MPRILFLTAQFGAPLAHNDNHIRLPDAFAAAGWQVDAVDHDRLRLVDGRVLAGPHDVASADRVWVLGLGRAQTFLDRMQLLRRVPQHAFVTIADAFVYQHAKYAWSGYMPETHAGVAVDALVQHVQPGEDWVVKPTAGSFGREVVRVRGPDAARRALESATDHGRRYALLQRFVPDIVHGEKRTLIAGARIIGTWLRQPGRDFRTNLALDGRAVATALTDAEAERVALIHADLRAAGVGYAAIDLAGLNLMEVNLANPGGLATLAAVYGVDHAPAVVAALAAPDWRAPAVSARPLR